MSQVIQTTRFRKVQIRPQKVLHFPQGLIGFESSREFVLIHDGDRKLFLWLQSIAQPDLCFLLVEPKRIVDFFEPALSQEDETLLEAKNGDKISFLSLVHVDESHENIYVNLKSPIAINPSKRIGRQVILEDDRFPIRYPLKSKPKEAKKSEELESAVIKIS